MARWDQCLQSHQLLRYRQSILSVRLYPVVLSAQLGQHFLFQSVLLGQLLH